MSLAALTLAAEPLADAFHRDGYLILRDVIANEAVDDLLENVRWLASRETGTPWDSAHSVSLARHLAVHRDQRQRLHEQARVPAWLNRFALQKGVVDAVRNVLGPRVRMLRKIDLELASPLETQDLAVWHQDHFYTRGSRRTLSAWIPLQDTGLREGCLMIMPGSHRLGQLTHDNLVLGKRHHPSAIEDREIRMVPMYKGDVLLMHSLLLHSGQINLSPAMRYAVRPRFVPFDAAWSKRMGGVVEVP